MGVRGAASATARAAFSLGGYKLHLDVTDMGIPVAAVVTVANVHDSQVTIPMEKLTAARVTHLYSLMDSAYDPADTRSCINACGRKPIIDANKRGGDTAERMDPAAKRRYAIRSAVERSNAHLKDWLLPSKMLVKGHKKVSFCLFSGVVCLAAVKILQQMIARARSGGLSGLSREGVAG